MAYLVQSNPTICIVHVEDCQKVGTSYIAYVTPELTDQQSLLFVLMLTTVYGKRKQNVADLRAFYKVHQIRPSLIYVLEKTRLGSSEHSLGFLQKRSGKLLCLGRSRIFLFLTSLPPSSALL